MVVLVWFDGVGNESEIFRVRSKELGRRLSLTFIWSIITLLDQLFSLSNLAFQFLIIPDQAVHLGNEIY